MRTAVLIFMTLLMANVARAECLNSCCGEVVDIRPGKQGQIFVESFFTLDGVKQTPNDIGSIFPKDLGTKDIKGIEAAVLAHIKAICSRMIYEKYRLINGNYVITEYNQGISDSLYNDLLPEKSQIIGISGGVDSTYIGVDNNNDGVNEKFIEVTTNGTKNITDTAPISDQSAPLK